MKPASQSDSPAQALNFKEMSQKFAKLAECPREIWLVYALKFVEASAYFTTSFILTKFLSEEIGFSDIDAGWLYGAWGMMVSVFGMIFGFAIDNLGVRLSLFFGVFFLFVARSMIAFGHSQAQMLAVFLVVYPIGAAFAIPVQTLALRRYTDENTQKFAFSIFYVIMNISAASAAFLINGVRSLSENGVELFGAHLTMYRVVLLTGVVCTILSIALIAGIREIRAARDGSHNVAEFQPQTGSPWQIMTETMQQPKFWRFLMITVIFIGVRTNFSHMDATFPKYSTREFGDDFPFELFMAINPIAIIFLVPFFTYFSHVLQLGFAPVLIIGSFCSGISPLFLAASNSTWAAVAWLVMLSIGEAIWSPKLLEFSVSIAPEGREGTYMSLAGAPLFLSKLATGGFSGWLLETYCPENGDRNPQMMWLVIGCVTLFPSVVLLLAKNALIKEEDDVSEDRQALTQSKEEQVYGSVKAETKV